MMSLTLRFFLNQPLKQWLLRKKEGKMNIQKFEYLKNEKSFLGEIFSIVFLIIIFFKTFFIVFERLSFGEKQKVDKK